MKTDFDIISEMLTREEFDGATGQVEEFGLIKAGKKELTNKCLQIEADNGKGHGQKGHRKSYLSFIFTLDGKLSEIQTYIPSTEANFTFFDNSYNEGK